MRPLLHANRHFPLVRSLLLMIVLCMSLLAALFMVNVALAEPSTPSVPEAPGSIAGIVRDEQGAPLADIRMTLYQGFSSTEFPVRVVTTTATGAYKVPILPPGLYRLQATDTAQRYGPLYYPQSPSLSGATDIPVAGNQVTNIDLTLAPAARITGVVTILHEMTATNGEIAVYTQVGQEWAYVNSYAITTTGRYTVAPLSAGAFRLCAHTYVGSQFFRGCYAAAAQIEKATDVILRAGETKSNLTIVLGQEQYDGAISGLVTADGVGLPGIRVNLYMNSPLNPLLVYTMTNATGHYAFGGLSDGGYTLEFFDPAAVYARSYYDNQRSGETAAFISIQQGATITGVNAILLKGGAISGTIRRNNGTPVPNVPVMVGYKINAGHGDAWIWNADFTATDTNGHYQIQRLWPDRYWVCTGLYTPFGQDCYGVNFPGSPENSGIQVTGGVTVTDIDIILGPDFALYLPAIAR